MSKKIHQGIACPYCGGLSHTVKDTTAFRGTIRRTRNCENCKNHFYTVEKVDNTTYAKRRKQISVPKVQDSYTCSQCIHWNKNYMDPEAEEDIPCTLGFPESLESIMFASECSVFTSSDRDNM